MHNLQIPFQCSHLSVGENIADGEFDVNNGFRHSVRILKHIPMDMCYMQLSLQEEISLEISFLVIVISKAVFSYSSLLEIKTNI